MNNVCRRVGWGSTYTPPPPPAAHLVLRVPIPIPQRSSTVPPHIVCPPPCGQNTGDIWAEVCWAKTPSQFQCPLEGPHGISAQARCPLSCPILSHSSTPPKDRTEGTSGLKSCQLRFTHQLRFNVSLPTCGISGEMSPILSRHISPSSSPTEGISELKSLYTGMCTWMIVVHLCCILLLGSSRSLSHATQLCRR